MGALPTAPHYCALSEVTAVFHGSLLDDMSRRSVIIVILTTISVCWSSTMSASDKVRTGGCLCGKVKFRLEGEAATPMWNTVCYCLNCRRATGSALYTASICPQNVSKR